MASLAMTYHDGVFGGLRFAGLEQGDIITRCDGQKVDTLEELNKIKDARSPGEMLECEVYKYKTGFTTTVSIKLTEQKPEEK